MIVLSESNPVLAGVRLVMAGVGFPQVTAILGLLFNSVDALLYLSRPAQWIADRVHAACRDPDRPCPVGAGIRAGMRLPAGGLKFFLAEAS